MIFAGIGMMVGIDLVTTVWFIRRMRRDSVFSRRIMEALFVLVGRAYVVVTPRVEEAEGEADDDGPCYEDDCDSEELNQ